MNSSESAKTFTRIVITIPTTPSRGRNRNNRSSFRSRSCRSRRDDYGLRASSSSPSNGSLTHRFQIGPDSRGTKSTAIGIAQCHAGRLMHKQTLSNIALTRSALWATQSTTRLSQTPEQLENWHAHRPIEASSLTSLLPCRVCLDAA